MQCISDRDLLDQFARNASEDAFGELVRRYIGLVHSVALRHTDNPHNAEEITQAVFIILARKAGSLGGKVVLGGWLYHAARLTAANFRRSELSRTRREQEAFMQSNFEESTSETAWRELVPLLDQAMAGLGVTDRNAVVLRYFQNKSFSEVGLALGMEEQAAQKRVSRALEKLHRFFSRHGVTTTTAIIAGAISENSVQAAPATLAKSVTALAMAKGATATGSTLTLIKGALKIMAWTKAKTAVVAGAVILLTAATATVTVKEISRHREDAVWSEVTRMDSRQVEAASPAVSVRPARFSNGGYLRTGNGKILGSRASVAKLLSSAYEISEDRIVDSAALPAGKYDFIVSLPNRQSQALQAEIKKKLGLRAKKETRETDVLLLKVASPDAPGLKPAAEPGSGGGATANSGEFTCKSLPISALRSFLEECVRTPVIDETALTGEYDINLKWSQPGGYQSHDVEVLKQAVLDTLGLELVPARQSIEMLVVEKGK